MNNWFILYNSMEYGLLCDNNVRVEQGRMTQLLSVGVVL